MEATVTPTAQSPVITEQAAPTAQTAAPQQAAAKPFVPPFIIEPLHKRRRFLKMMVYGDFGVGKTYLASTAQDVSSMRNTLLLDVEAGDMSIDHRSDIDAVTVKTYNMLSKVHEFLCVYCKLRDSGDMEKLLKLENKLREEPLTAPKVYHTVIIDSISEIQKMLMYQILGIEVGKTTLDTEPQSPEWKEWGKSSEMIRLMVRSFRDLPMHVIFVSSEKVGQDDTQKMFHTPNLPGKLASDVQGFLDCVGYMVAGEVRNPGEDPKIERRLYITPGRTYQAKNRFNSPLSYIAEPTMSKLIALHQTTHS